MVPGSFGWFGARNRPSRVKAAWVVKKLLNTSFTMCFRTEIPGLLIGLSAVVFELIVVFFWPVSPENFYKLLVY